MQNCYLIETTKMKDIDKIEKYNNEFSKIYPNSWKPFVTRENFN